MLAELGQVVLKLNTVSSCNCKRLVKPPSSRRVFSTSAAFNTRKKDTHKSGTKAKDNIMYADCDDFEDYYEPTITHGESVVDRKSVFQGHSASVRKQSHVNIFLDKLKENKKIENAFHNMWAYRIDRNDPQARFAGKSASVVQDCDDDGEQAAGGRLLNLLQILNVVNVMVVVTRWYGGIQLGPARFKHINNAARDALVKGGFVQQSGDAGAAEPSGSGGGKAGAGKGKSKRRAK